jgi:hypothetical protein
MGPMLVLDLRWVLFAALLVFAAAVGLATGLLRPLDRRRREGVDHVSELGGLAPALEHAPFGLLLLDGPRAYRFRFSGSSCRTRSGTRLADPRWGLHGR